LGAFKSFKQYKQSGQRFERFELFERCNGVPSMRRSVVFQRQAEPWCNFLTQLFKSPGAAAVDQHGGAPFQA
jgi:hypothetical protein